MTHLHKLNIFLVDIFFDDKKVSPSKAKIMESVYL